MLLSRLWRNEGGLLYCWLLCDIFCYRQATATGNCVWMILLLLTSICIFTENVLSNLDRWLNNRREYMSYGKELEHFKQLYLVLRVFQVPLFFVVCSSDRLPGRIPNLEDLEVGCFCCFTCCDFAEIEDAIREVGDLHPSNWIPWYSTVFLMIQNGRDRKPNIHMTRHSKYG